MAALLSVVEAAGLALAAAAVFVAVALGGALAIGASPTEPIRVSGV